MLSKIIADTLKDINRDLRNKVMAHDDSICPDCGTPLNRIPNGLADYDLECPGCGLSA